MLEEIHSDSIVPVIRPNLQIVSWHFQITLQSTAKNELRNYVPGPVHCLEHHLKSIVLKRYQAKTPVVNFAKFFILNAKVLKVMKFGVQDITRQNEKWMTNQRRRLQLDNKASQDARFDFDSKYWSDYLESTRIDDFSVSDPFDLSLDWFWRWGHIAIYIAHLE